MHVSRLIKPVNSLIFVSDRAGGTIPFWQKNKQVLWTDSCISVACYPEQDGATEVTLGEGHEVNPGFRAKFDGMLETPNRIVTVQDVTHEIILSMEVAARLVRVQVWLNHPHWANKIDIGVG
jgi:hypothetical protein